MDQKHGFTLVELLGVMTLLALLALIVAAPITRSIQDANQKTCEGQFKQIILAAKQWGEDHKLELPDVIGTSKEIHLIDLKKAGYVESDLKNPVTKELLDDQMLIAITKDGKKYWSYKLVESNAIRMDKIENHYLFNNINDYTSSLPFFSRKYYMFNAEETQNQIVFSDACWSIVNVAENGSAKLVYEGKATSSLDCQNVRTDASGKIDVNVAWNIGGSREWNDANTVIRTTLEQIEKQPDLIHVRTSDLDKLEKATFYTGIVSLSRGDTIEGTRLKEEPQSSYVGKIGTLNISDYVKICAAKKNGANSVYQTTQGINYCNDNYLQKSYSYWFMSASTTDQKAWAFTPTKTMEANLNDQTIAVRPVVYLKANTYLKGTGTAENPYKIADIQNMCQ